MTHLGVVKQFSKISNPKFITASKGEQTKGKIIQQAAELFNQQGYAGWSMSDIMRVTGLKKGRNL
jgi:AcrR family transcriptional regulator